MAALPCFIYAAFIEVTHTQKKKSVSKKEKINKLQTMHVLIEVSFTGRCPAGLCDPLRTRWQQQQQQQSLWAG